MAKPGDRSGEVFIDTSKASVPVVQKTAAPVEAPKLSIQAPVTESVAVAKAARVPAITALERAADTAHRSGDFLTESHLREVANAAGHLRQKVTAAIGVVTGPASAVIEALYSAL